MSPRYVLALSDAKDYLPADQTCVNGACVGVCSSDAGICSGSQPRTCDANGQWQNAGSACAQPTPDCTAGSCTCLETTCADACVDLQTDPGNCGACGRICDATCTGGLCVLASAANQTDNTGGIATDGTNVYWTYSSFGTGAVLSVPIGGGAITSLASGVDDPQALAVAGSNAYFATFGTFASVSTLGGGTVTTLGVGDFGPGIAVGSGDVYVTDYAIGSVDAVPMGSASNAVPNPLLSIAGNVWAIALDSANVYFTTYDTGPGILQAPLKGGTVTTLSSSQGYGIAVDATSVYWTDGSTLVMKVPIGGGTVTTLASGQVNPRGITVDATNVYWTTWNGASGNGTVMKVPVGGGPAVTLASAVMSVDGAIAVDATNVYWASATAIVKTPKE